MLGVNQIFVFLESILWLWNCVRVCDFLPHFITWFLVIDLWLLHHKPPPLTHTHAHIISLTFVDICITGNRVSPLIEVSSLSSSSHVTNDLFLFSKQPYPLSLSLRVWWMAKRVRKTRRGGRRTVMGRFELMALLEEPHAYQCSLENGISLNHSSSLIPSHWPSTCNRHIQESEEDS